MSQGLTYSFKSLTGVLTNPVFGVTIPLTGGNIGAGSFTVRMTTTRTVQDVAADGTIMPSYIAGDNGELDIQVQETSLLHKALLGLYNQCVLAANNDDVLGWAATAISFVLLADGTWEGAGINVPGVSVTQGQAIPGGFLNLAQPYSQQSPSDRAAGKAMPIYSFVTTAGAVQSLLIGVYTQL